MRGFARFGPYVILGALLALSVPPWPDDWDGLGFLASVTRFDLDRFAPHPPGYPVYVALLRIAHLVLSVPMVAAGAVAVVSGVAALAAIVGAASRTAARSGAAWVGVAVAVAPLWWRCVSGVGSEAPALAFAALALYAATFRTGGGALVLGAAVGLGLGVRASWAPLLVPMLVLAPPGHRLRALVACAVATCAWAAPLLATVGPAHYVALLRAHLAGHATRWGGTALTQPVRARYLARDLFVDGLGVGFDLEGLAIGALLVVVGGLGVVAWRRAGWRGAGLAACVAAPYLAWIAVGQNLREQPRHALPVVVGLAAAVGIVASRVARARVPVALLAALMAVRTASDAHERRTIPPPGVQLVALARAFPAPGDVAVFGQASARFFASTDLAGAAHEASTLGEVTLALTRLDTLPAHVLVTSEIGDLDRSPYPLDRRATLCRPPRLDRRAPCLEVYDLHVPGLPVR